MRLGIGSYLISNLLDMRLQIGTSLLRLTQLALRLLQVLLLVDIGGHFDVEAHQQVFEVLFACLGRFEFELQVGVGTLVEHVVREALGRRRCHYLLRLADGGSG